MRWLYCILLYIATPFVLARLLLRSRSLPAYRQRIAERFGWVEQARQPIAVWVHAVSVGESLAAMPMIEKLIQEHGPARVWVTTTTPTGSERVVSLLGDRVAHSYAPYDLPGSVTRFIRRVRPAQVVIMETELWPNLFRELHVRKIPILIANARISPRSLKGYSRISGLTREVLGYVSLVAAQSRADADRFSALGALRVANIGNIKFDVAPPQGQVASGKHLRNRLGGFTRPVWIAASTHDGEEQAAIRAHSQLRKKYADAVLLLVPRHPQRFGQVRELLERSGQEFISRSTLGEPASWAETASSLDTGILLGDSLGEMWMYLQAADIAFVGGSLAPVGGHNVLEPAVLGVPVLFGPSMHNFVAARELMISSRAGLEIADASELALRLGEILDDSERRQNMGAAGQKAVRDNQGALERLMNKILALGPARA